MIFIVDDERLIAHTLRLIVERAGYRCEVFHDGAEAVSAIARLRPQVLITDVAMRHMDGFELAGMVSALAPECAILLMSGHLSVDQMNLRCAPLGWMVVEKPFHPGALLRWLEGARATNLGTAAQPRFGMERVVTAAPEQSDVELLVL